MQPFAAVGQMALLSALTLFATQTAVAAGPLNLLSNAGAEEPADRQSMPPGWFPASVPAPELRMFIDDRHSRAGNASLAITNQHQYDQTVCNNWAQDVRSIPTGKTVRLTGYLRTDDAESANLCVQCWADNGERMVAFASTPIFRGTQGWTLVQAADLAVPRETTRMIVRAVLTGKGSVFFDDVSLEVVDRPEAGISDPNDPQIAHRIVRRLPVTKDCMVLAYMLNWDRGDVDNLAVSNNDGGVRTLLAWEPPSQEETEQAQLRFFLAMYARKTIVRDEPGPLEIHKLLGDWGERVSWSNQPDLAPEAAAAAEVESGEGWRMFDVTDLVREQARSPQNNHGVALCLPAKKTGQDTVIEFVSRHAPDESRNLRPMLLVVKPDSPPGT
ncbi:MAG TPA: DNRLRE domain-containing protein [Pirellulales bacterium]|nr:DNRLRE domain-containing protein [Pirellulales bacterium]